MKTKLPYNLQTFADGEPAPDVTETKPDGNEVKPSPAPDVKETKEDDTPNVQELMNELAKTKRAFDKASSELASAKKELREKMTEKEKADAEKAEAEAKRAEEFEYYKRKDKIHETEKAYLKLGYTADEAERIAEAEADGDFEAKTKIMAEVDERKKKELEAEFIKNRPDVNAGNGGGAVTKEQFDQMSMIERSALRKDDPDTYNRMLGNS